MCLHLRFTSLFVYRFINLLIIFIYTLIYLYNFIFVDEGDYELMTSRKGSFSNYNYLPYSTVCFVFTFTKLSLETSSIFDLLASSISSFEERSTNTERETNDH